MKKIAMMLLGLAAMTFSLAAYAGDDRPVKFSELPAAAQTFVNSHFGGLEVLLAKKDPGVMGTTYEVMLADGTKIDFDKEGQWVEVERKNEAVPAAIVPAEITAHVARHHGGATIIGIERERRGYEVKLNNGLDVKFDKNFNMVDIDD